MISNFWNNMEYVENIENIVSDFLYIENDLRYRVLDLQKISKKTKWKKNRRCKRR